MPSYPDLHGNIRPGGMLHALASSTGKLILFYCAFGERSAMANWTNLSTPPPPSSDS